MEGRRYLELVGKAIEKALDGECLVVFFGSVLRQDFGRSSDIDVAVFCSEPLKGHEYGRILSEFEKLPILRDIDLVDLWCVNSPEFLSKILEEGFIWKSSEGLMNLLKERLEDLRRLETKA